MLDSHLLLRTNWENVEVSEKKSDFLKRSMIQMNKNVLDVLYSVGT